MRWKCELKVKDLQQQNNVPRLRQSAADKKVLKIKIVRKRQQRKVDEVLAWIDEQNALKIYDTVTGQKIMHAVNMKRAIEEQFENDAGVVFDESYEIEDLCFFASQRLISGTDKSANENLFEHYEQCRCLSPQYQRQRSPKTPPLQQSLQDLSEPKRLPLPVQQPLTQIDRRITQHLQQWRAQNPDSSSTDSEDDGVHTPESSSDSEAPSRLGNNQFGPVLCFKISILDAIWLSIVVFTCQISWRLLLTLVGSHCSQFDASVDMLVGQDCVQSFI